MTTQKNVIKVAMKQQKDKELSKRDNIKESDAIEGVRTAHSAQAGRWVLKTDKKLEK
jgi:hypothetical protein